MLHASSGLTYLGVMADAAMDGNIQIRRATIADTLEITRLVNLAFRRAESFFVDGERIDIGRVRGLLEKGTFLLAEDAAGLAGCVYVELRGERGYFGLLAVEPSKQRLGLGRQLALEAEELARADGCRIMDIQTVNVRTELPAIYRKMGYAETGTAPFPAEVATKQPCHFVIMSKALG
jgi:GNAT superfamily N-acetyltransferase